MIYINGIKATKKDLQALNEYIKKGLAEIKKVTRTAKGSTALTVEA